MAPAGIAIVTWDLELVQKLARLLNPRVHQAAHAAEIEESRNKDRRIKCPRERRVLPLRRTLNIMEHERQDQAICTRPGK